MGAAPGGFGTAPGLHPLPHPPAPTAKTTSHTTRLKRTGFISPHSSCSGPPVDPQNTRRITFVIG
jgi:hypothetical protein